MTILMARTIINMFDVNNMHEGIGLYICISYSMRYSTLHNMRAG